MGKVKFSGNTRRNKREKKGIPFVITYHPSLKNIGRTINQNLYILYMNEDVKVYLHRLQSLLSVMRKTSAAI